MNLETFQAAVDKGVANGDWSSLEEWITSESSFSYDYGSQFEESFSQEVFALICKLMQQREFLKVKGSSNVLRVLEYDWSLLSDSQKTALLPLLAEAYSEFKDPLSWFIVVELLGEYFKNEDSFHILRQLRRVTNDQPRSLIPMGLAHIVKTSKDKNLSAQAYAELVSMKADSSEDVRDEVERAVGSVLKPA